MQKIKEVKVVKIEKATQILDEQIVLLANWNKDNINNEPEQVRKNTETIATILCHKDFHQL